MNTQRMLRLAEHLEQLPPDSPFEMGHWGGERTTTRRQLGGGETGDAMGYATQIPEFFAAGLYLSDDGTICYGDKTTWAAAESFMGISCETARYCLGYDTYLNPLGYFRDPTPTEVAFRIRSAVARYLTGQGEQK